MKSFQMLAVASLTAMAFVFSAAPSFAGPGQRHRAQTRGVAASPRPMPRAVRPVQRHLQPAFGIGRTGLSTSHLRSHGLGYGLGYGYGLGSYDPFWSGYAMGPASGYYAAPVSNLGGVRIKNAPRDAEVYVDGGYAGRVDSFDGRFQRLTLEPGAYRIDVRRAGVEQTVNVNVQPGRTTTISVGPS